MHRFAPAVYLVTGAIIGGLAVACTAGANQPNMQAALGSLQAARGRTDPGPAQQGRPSRARHQLRQCRDLRDRGRHQLRRQLTRYRKDRSMLRLFSKSPTAILVTGVTIGAIAGACAVMAAQPNMQAALGSLQAARAELVKADGQQGRPSRTRDRLCRFRDRRNQGRHRLRRQLSRRLDDTAWLARRRAVMAKAKKTAPRKNKRPASCAGRQPARRPVEMGEGRRRRFGRRALRQRRVRSRSPSAWASARSSRAARAAISACACSWASARPSSRRPTSRRPRCARWPSRAVDMARAVPGGPGMRHRAGGIAGAELARPRSRRQEPALGQGAAGHGGRSRGCGARRQGRDQLRGRRGKLGPDLGDAGGQQRLLRRLSAQRLFAVLRGAGRRRHRHGARLRMVERRASRRPHGGRARSAATPASSSCAGSIRARPRARACRWSTTGASRAG